MSRYVVGIDLGTTNSALAFADSSAPESPIRAFSDPPGRRLGGRRRQAGPAVVPVPTGGEGIRAGGNRPAVEEEGGSMRRHVCKRSWSEGSRPTGRIGQELAVSPGGRSAIAAVAVGRGRRTWRRYRRWRRRPRICRI